MMFWIWLRHVWARRRPAVARVVVSALALSFGLAAATLAESPAADRPMSEEEQMEADLAAVDVKLRALDEEESGLRKSLTDRHKAIFDARQGAEDQDPEIAELRERVLVMRKELDELQRQLEERVVALPDVQDLRTAQEADTARMRDMRTLRLQLHTERVQINTRLLAKRHNIDPRTQRLPPLTIPSAGQATPGVVPAPGGTP
jgi:septal ring factor EnvC (AmiA/AmiB activator)